MSITANVSRIGNITSSPIVALTSMGSREMTEEELAARPKKGKGSSTKSIPCGFGKAALTYIEERNMERRLLKSLDSESNARPLSWGKLCEGKAFDELGLEYILESQETTVHSEIKFWAGSADGFKDEKETVVDIKCPMTLKSFCNLVDPFIVDGKIVHPALTIEAVRANHDDGEKYYWQLVSNGIINKSKFAELIIYIPYLSELQDIRERAQAAPDNEIYKYFWIANANDEELPHIIEGGYYKNINIIRFEIPQSDKDFLTERVKEAGKLLQPFYKK